MSEESARKARIRRQINAKQDIVDTCEEELSILEEEQKRQETLLNQWLFQEVVKTNTPIMNEMVIPGVNQGLMAEQMRESFFDGFQQMTVTKQELNDEMSDLQEQIDQVRDYISQLEDEIRSLRNRL